MNNSCIFNLTIKYRDGKKVWFDRVQNSQEELLGLDMDDEIHEMIYNPPKAER
tara:strand:- start:747 stop:905 length:159 start_codon:yes stop_codon:yes gene_type:complete